MFYHVLMIFEPIIETPVNIITVYPIINKTICVSHHFCWLVPVDIRPVAFFCFQLLQLMMIQLFHYFLLLQPDPKRPKLFLINIIIVSKHTCNSYRKMMNYEKDFHHFKLAFFVLVESSLCLLYDVFKLNCTL